MIPFIELVAKDLLEKKINFSNTSLIFPGKRPIIFFKNTLKKLGYVGILPELITIEEWVGKISGIHVISGINLWFVFYTIYCASVKEPKSFQEFLKWAPTLLNDFNDLDKSLSSPKEFFYALASSERIEKWGKQDWEKDITLLNQEILFWKEMELVYLNTVKYFSENKKGYEGFAYKEALQNLPTYLENPENKFVFVGFNVLTKIEEKIITHCLNKGKAFIYWEADEYYLNNKEQEAGDFLRKYQKWNYYNKESFSFKLNNFRKEKVINTYSVSNSINQVKLLSNILKDLTQSEIENTAVVLADENLLFPLLNSLPNNIKKVNITMGMPLKYIPIVSFFDNLILLHNNRIEKKHNNNAFYFLDLFNFFDSSLIKKAKEENEFIRLLKKNNRSFISISLINTHLKNSLYLTLLQDFTSALAFISILIDWLDNFIAENEKIFSAITLEALIHFHQLFKILLLETTKSEIAITFSSLSYLYNTLKNTNKIPFVGEPVTGLQILGMLETRLLNFEKIFILDVNEGIISPDNQQNSLVSFDFRKNFNLTTFKDRDAIYAYHFYRFLQNAKEVNLFYSEGISKMNNLEKSRFITQLEIESEHKINKIIATPNLSISYNENTVVEKTQTILNKIKEIYKKGVSPSSIKTYIRNPLDFYLIKILEIRENKEVELVMAQNSMGTVIHSCLQALYNEHLNKILLPLNFLEIKSKIHDVVEIIFKDNFKEGEILYGKNHLIFKVVLKIIEKIIETDEKLVKEGNELIIEALELKLEAPFLLNYNNEVVNFKGEIDRIDSLNGMKRILDYKTGNVDLADLTITAEKTEKITKDIKFENAVQLSIYTYLYLHNNKNVSNVIAGIYSVPNIKKGLLPLTINKISEIGMESLAPQLEKIRLLLIEILNAETPFIEDQKKYF